MSGWSTPKREHADTVSLFSDDFHYEQHDTAFPHAFFWKNRGIWVNAHDDFEILYVETGRIRLYVDDTLMILHAGEAAVIDPRLVHFGFLDEGTQHGAILCRDQLALKGLPYPELQVFEQILRGELHFERRVLTPERDAKLLDVICRLLNVYREQNPYWRLSAVSLFCAFAEICLRTSFLSEREEQHTRHADTRKSDIALYLRFTEYVNRNYAAPLTLGDVAAELGISESKLYKICRSIQGISPVECILEWRLKQAERMLRGGDTSVTDICYACGFGTVSYFISRFREKYGVTPKQYREKCTEK